MSSQLRLSNQTTHRTLRAHAITGNGGDIDGVPTEAGGWLEHRFAFLARAPTCGFCDLNWHLSPVFHGGIWIRCMMVSDATLLIKTPVLFGVGSSDKGVKDASSGNTTYKIEVSL